MLLPAAQIGNIPAIPFQFGALSIELLQLFIRNSHNFRGFKTGCGIQRNNCSHISAGHCLISCHTGIHIGFPTGIIAQSVCFHFHLFHGFQIIVKIISIFTELSRKRSQKIPVLIQAFQFLFPGFISGIQIFNRPGIFYRDFAAFKDFFNMCHRASLLKII